jgi:hypothetical protein
MLLNERNPHFFKLRFNREVKVRSIDELLEIMHYYEQRLEKARTNFDNIVKKIMANEKPVKYKYEESCWIIPDTSGKSAYILTKNDKYGWGISRSDISKPNRENNLIKLNFNMLEYSEEFERAYDLMDRLLLSKIRNICEEKIEDYCNENLKTDKYYNIIEFKKNTVLVTYNPLEYKKFNLETFNYTPNFFKYGSN